MAQMAPSFPRMTIVHTCDYSGLITYPQMLTESQHRIWEDCAQASAAWDPHRVGGQDNFIDLTECEDGPLGTNSSSNGSNSGSSGGGGSSGGFRLTVYCKGSCQMDFAGNTYMGGAVHCAQHKCFNNAYRVVKGDLSAGNSGLAEFGGALAAADRLETVIGSPMFKTDPDYIWIKVDSQEVLGSFLPGQQHSGAKQRLVAAIGTKLSQLNIPVLMSWVPGHQTGTSPDVMGNKAAGRAAKAACFDIFTTPRQLPM